jgi:hypothetical protein
MAWLLLKWQKVCTVPQKTVSLSNGKNILTLFSKSQIFPLILMGKLCLIYEILLTFCISLFGNKTNINWGVPVSIEVHVSIHVFSFTSIASAIISFHTISTKYTSIIIQILQQWYILKRIQNCHMTFNTLFTFFTYFRFLTCWLRHNRLWTMYLYRSIFNVSCPMAASILSFKRNKSASWLLNFITSSWKEIFM